MTKSHRGKKKCEGCHGTGRFKCYRCGNKRVKCEECKGSGKVDFYYYTCSKCGYDGRKHEYHRKCPVCHACFGTDVDKQKCCCKECACAYCNRGFWARLFG